MDERTAESRIWPKWMGSADQIVSAFAELDDDPFGYNETASVSLLCSAAARCGYLALAEYATTKRGRDNKKKSAPGRCDLYLDAQGHDWEFEFKQFFPWSVPRRRLQSWWGKAVESAECLRKDGARHLIAGLLVNFYNLPADQHDRGRTVLGEFAKQRQFAWHFPARSHAVTDTFLFLERI
jgi:hypothetical protein